MKFCKDCKWCQEKKTYEVASMFGNRILEKPEVELVCSNENVWHRDLVTGDAEIVSCQLARYGVVANCGKDGVLWEAK